MADPKEKEEEEIIAVGDGVEEEEEKEELEEELEEEELEEEEEEERLGAGEDDEEGDEKRSKRRDERKTRRQRQKTARDRDKTELNFLRGRNEQLERQHSAEIANLDARVGQSETAQIDLRINDVKSKIKLADQVITKAIDQSDGSAVVEAQGIRDNLRDNLSQLNTAKNYMTQQRQQPQQPQVDPRLVQHAGAWMQDHTWWNPNGGDADSLRVSELDAQMVREGHDPTTPEYWDMLSDRVEEAIPHRFGNGDARTSRKKGKRKASGPTMSVSGRERPLKKNEVYISPDRKEAMIEAGVWEDPELRQKYLKQYAKYDSENRA